MSETLSERITRLRAEAERTVNEQRKRAYQSGPARTARDIAGFTWFLTGVGMGLFWVWEKIARPVWRFARRPMSWAMREYIGFWNYVTIIRDPYGKPTFSKTRAGLMVIGTLIFWFILLGPLLALAADCVIYALTAEVDEKLTLLSSQPLDEDRNTYIVVGCTEYPCTDQNSLSFKVRTTLFNDLWSVIHLRGFSFYPDRVAAPIPMDVSECVITSYGIRQNIFGVRMFPDILSVKSCIVVLETRKEKSKQ